MNIRSLKWVIVSFTLSSFVFVISSCTLSYVNMPLELEEYPVERGDDLFPGYTREYVYSLLGEPLIDASKIGVQVFQHIAPPGSNFYPAFSIPFLRGDVYIYTLVTYDESYLVKGRSYIIFPWESSTYLDGFSFLGIETGEPQTLLGPSISLKELAETATPENSCALIVLFSECPMANVSLDKVQIIDLGGVDFYCKPGLNQSEQREHNYYGTYIKKYIHTGGHNIEMSKGRWNKKYESNFECKHGDVIFAEFKAHGFEKSLWHGTEPEGAISIYRTPHESVIKGDKLWPILWHGGVWYGPPGILRERK